MGSSGLRKLWARDTKLGTWVHLGKDCLAPYDLMSWGAVCTCSASVLDLLFFSCPYRPNVGTADAKLASHMYTTPTCVFSWLPSYGVQAARARTRIVYSKGILRF